MRKKYKKWVLYSVVGLFLFIAILFWIFIVGIKASETGKFFNQQKNAVWIAHEWVDTVKTDTEVKALVADLKAHDVNTIFVHVGPLSEIGDIAPEVYSEAFNFVDMVKAVDPDMRILAWVGQIRNKINLSSVQVRHNILQMCTIFTGVVGMDGVQYDIEPVWDEDEDFILLLEETHELFESMDRRPILSVALAEFIPRTFVWLSSGFLNLQNYNTEVNYRNVSKYADQVVTMVYDTGIERGWMYRWLVKEQVIWLTDLMDEVECDKCVGMKPELYIGIPSYEDVKKGFNPEIENVGNALIGVLNGLNDVRAVHENLTGIAVYAHWTTDDNEWDIYDALWKN
ncbi:MAG TPA: hypothetical protein PK398_01820 [Candidatus Gracilibacteria bacterium]|nr:hypothetical protein [Candidatus Gracilibacteria bacterium]